MLSVLHQYILFSNPIATYFNKRKTIKEWITKGKPVPPPHVVKQTVVKRYAKQFRTQTLVETGTYYGEMIDAMHNLFKNVISVELGEQLYSQALQRFSDYPNVVILHGDSGELMPRIIANLTGPTLFWLDGHFSEGITARGVLRTPIIQELHAILAAPMSQHVVLVDDARCFDGTNDYPTQAQLRELVAEYRPEYSFCSQDDIIRILPKA
jgi:hypothetical protein